MLHPTIDELTNQDFNRYELALAAARCARLITDEYTQQKEAAERAMGNSKEADRSVINKLNKEYREEKALKNALTMIKAGDYKLVKNASELEVPAKSDDLTIEIEGAAALKE